MQKIDLIINRVDRHGNQLARLEQGAIALELSLTGQVARLSQRIEKLEIDAPRECINETAWGPDA